MENLQVKAKDWSYEKEVRILKNPYGLYTINKKAITKIYFGISTTDHDIQAVRKTCKDAGYESVKFYKGSKAHGKFKVVFSKV